MSDGTETDLEHLEDERDFLLASLEDLEREHAAGDLDDLDYAALRDDYTARAARVLRAIEAGAAPPASAPARDRRRTVAAVALVALFAVVAGVLVAQSVGRRNPGDTATGGVRQSVTEKLNEAGRLLATDGPAAIELYDEVIAQDPGNVEALTYRGWGLYLSGESGEGLTSLIEAATANPRYPDVHAFLAIVFFRNGLLDEASRELDRLDALQPPSQIRQLTSGLRDDVEAARASTTTTVAP
jgi:tetratricopeptide (TPR) repeat protein